jgi:hypothetical protein
MRVTTVAWDGRAANDLPFVMWGCWKVVSRRGRSLALRNTGARNTVSGSVQRAVFGGAFDGTPDAKSGCPRMTPSTNNWTLSNENAPGMVGSTRSAPT